MQAKDIMTFGLSVTYPQYSIEAAASTMLFADVGALPVMEGEELCGIITDRDIVIKVIATGEDPKTTTVADAMSHTVITCYADQDLQEIVMLMEDNGVRRIVVVDDLERPVGIVTIDDLAIRSYDKELASQALHRTDTGRSRKFMATL